MLSQDLMNLVHHLEAQRDADGCLRFGENATQALNRYLCQASEKALAMETSCISTRVQFTEQMLQAENVIPFQRPSHRSQIDGGNQ